MARRMLAWALVTPVAAAGILLAHAVAYRLTGTGTGPAHAYLDHVPQVVAVLASLGLVGLAVQQRSARPPRWAFGVLTPLGFTCQEHVEQLLHTGELPLLLTTPTFLLGLLLQIPAAGLCVLVARRVAGTLTVVRRRRPTSIAYVWLPLTARPVSDPRAIRVARACGRAPPRFLVS